MNEQQQQINQMNALITSQLHNATDTTCDECSNTNFVPVFIIKKLSALLSPTGEDMNIPLQLFQCAGCGHVNEEWLPKADKATEESTDKATEESKA
jgi:uncharacterized Zn finger protein